MNYKIELRSLTILFKILKTAKNVDKIIIYEMDNLMQLIEYRIQRIKLLPDERRMVRY